MQVALVSALEAATDAVHELAEIIPLDDAEVFGAQARRRISAIALEMEFVRKACEQAQSRGESWARGYHGGS